MNVQINLRSRLAAFVAALLIGCAANQANGSEEKLIYERLYAASNVDLITGPTNYYLMFYRDGVVIGIATTGTPEQIKSWFTRESTSAGRGSYELRGNRLTFRLKVETGVIEYAGAIQNDRLTLDVLSRINGRRSQQVYSLVPPNAEQRAGGATR